MEKLKDLQITLVSSVDELPEIVAVHSRIFSDNVSGVIGRKFLRVFFNRIFVLPSGVIYAVKDNGKVVGLIAGLTSKKGFYNLSIIFFGALATLREIIVNPKIFILILRHLKRILFFGKCGADAEIMTMGMLEGYRKLGLGKKLLDSLEDFFSSKNVKEYEAFTDLEHGKAFAFYEKCGFSKAGEITFMKKRARVYVKSLT
ncbi:GNAT family N-acetyltransferase [Candidatus Omnitrophota bacterium]